MHSLSSDSMTPDGPWLRVDLQYFSLLLPGHDSLNLTPLEQRAPNRRHACDCAAHEGLHYPVFALDPALRLQTRAGEQCRLALLLRAGDDIFALACKGVERLDDGIPQRRALPNCMLSRRLPYREFVLLEGEAVALSDAYALLQLLLQQGVECQPTVSVASQRSAG